MPTAASEAQIYLFCLLGSTLFTDSSESRAKVGIIGGLTDVRVVAEKARGCCTCQHVSGARKASPAKGKNFCGCMKLLQSWIYEYFSNLRRADSPASRDVGALLAGRWDGVWLGGQSGEEGQQRLYMLRAQLDRLTYTHVQWLPYGSSPVSGDARWSRYFGGIHTFGFIKPHDPTRVLRQYGYRQTLTLARIPYSSATRRVDPKGYGVTYNKLANKYTKQGQWTAMEAYSILITVGAKDGNVSPGYMEWYLLPHTRTSYLPAWPLPQLVSYQRE
ncbi:Protein MAIN-LIKE 1 [Linum grandiflorum]